MEMAIGMKTVSAAFLPGYFGDGAMIGRALVMCLLDYVLAFTVLGLGGIFRERIASRSKGLIFGSLAALGARYLCHIGSGYILFRSYAEWYFTQEGFPAWGQQLVDALSPELLGWVYSIVYNGMYMVPEMIFTAIAAAVLARIPRIVTKIS